MMCLPRRQFDWEVDLPESGRNLPSTQCVCGQQQPISRKVVEIYRDLQRFAEICQIVLNFAFHSICVCGATQEICGPPKKWPLHDDNEAMRQSFAIYNSRDTI